MSVKCEALNKAFGGTQALSNIDLEFPSRGIIALVGPNGAGKTTLINILTGFERADSGRCFVDADDVTGRSPHWIAQLGVTRTFQEVRLLWGISIVENVMFARRRQAGEGILRCLWTLGIEDDELRNRKQAEQWLRFIGLHQLKHRTPDQLSYGQQKLLSLACSLATEARVLFLDEPIAGVDLNLREHTLQLLRQLRDDKRLIVFIEHDLDAVKEVADLVLVMDHGTVLTSGPPDVLYRDDVLKAYTGR